MLLLLLAGVPQALLSGTRGVPTQRAARPGGAKKLQTSGNQLVSTTISLLSSSFSSLSFSLSLVFLGFLRDQNACRF